MTTPTKVQIAAALEELRDKGITEGGVRCALAAAAEAGEQKTAEAPQPSRGAGINKSTQPTGTPKLDHATIERCAQEGTEFLKGLVAVWRKENGKITRFDAADCLEQAIEGYAAAIRAMKEQAPHSFEDNPLDWRRP